MKRLFLLAIMLMLTAFATAQSIRQSAKKVAVWETKCSDKSLNPTQMLMVRGGMETAVGNTTGYEVFDRSAFDVIMKEQGFQRSGAVNDADIKKMGKLAGVQYIIVPEASVSGSDFYIVVKMLDVETGMFGGVYDALCTPSGQDIRNACKELGTKLFGSANANTHVASTLKPLEPRVETLGPTNANEQNKLGTDYYNGRNGKSLDYEKAFYWFGKAAAQGHSEAQSWLGYCYQFGKGVKQDYSQAAYWYRKSAEQGSAYAQNQLGDCYFYGRGVTQDYYQAVYWYRKAADKGNANGQANLGWCYLKGYGITLDYGQAVYWLRKAAEKGKANAQCNLGWCYENGNGVPQSWNDAVYWYRKAAEGGNATGQNNLGWCYEYGRGVTKDISQAIYWYTKAADQGNSSAKSALERLR